MFMMVQYSANESEMHLLVAEVRKYFYC